MMNNGSEEAPAEALPPPPPPPPAVLMPASADPLAQHERDLSSREEELQRRVSWLAALMLRTSAC